MQVDIFLYQIKNGVVVADLRTVGDVWYFPPGVPHSIQAFEQGAEFLLVFDDVGRLSYLPWLSPMHLQVSLAILGFIYARNLNY